MSKVKNFFLKVWAWIKKASKAIGNFFKNKVWVWIKKAYKVCSDFLRENVWASVLAIVIGILLFIVLVQGIVKAIDKCQSEKNESTIENRATTITTSQLMDKLNANQSFVLFIGANTCSHCKEFYKTVNTYVKAGNTVYYVDLADTSDPTLERYYYVLEEKLKPIAKDRNITDLSTPLSVYVENGVFKDAVQGAYGMEGGSDYATWCDVMEGKYVGKSVYTFTSSAAS